MEPAHRTVQSGGLQWTRLDLQSLLKIESSSHTASLAGLEAVQHASTATPSTEDGFDKPPPVGDLPQRPRTTSAPGVRIEVLQSERKPWVASLAML